MKLKVYLAEKGMTNNDFSALVGCSFAYFSRIVNGRVKPGKRLAKDIEALTGGQVKLMEEKPETEHRI